MTIRLETRSKRSHLLKRWKRKMSAASGVVFSLTIFMVVLSLFTDPTELQDRPEPGRSAQISSNAEMLTKNNQHIDTSPEFKVIYSKGLAKSESSSPMPHPGGDVKQSSDKGSRIQGIEKKATPGFVSRWLLHYHRDHN